MIMNIENVKELVRSAKTYEALKELHRASQLFDIEHKNAFLLIESQYNKHSSDKAKGVIDDKDYNKEINKINNSIINYLDIISELYTFENNDEELKENIIDTNKIETTSVIEKYNNKKEEEEFKYGFFDMNDIYFKKNFIYVISFVYVSIFCSIMSLKIYEKNNFSIEKTIPFIFLLVLLIGIISRISVSLVGLLSYFYIVYFVIKTFSNGFISGIGLFFLMKVVTLIMALLISKNKKYDSDFF